MTGSNGIALHQQWPQKLTRREMEVALLVGTGMSNKEIARRLELSPGTVKLHVHSIFTKTGARNRYELMAKSAARSVA